VICDQRVGSAGIKARHASQAVRKVVVLVAHSVVSCISFLPQLLEVFISVYGLSEPMHALVGGEL
jgi:hypothetical protein